MPGGVEMKWQTVAFGIMIIAGILLLITGFLFGSVSADFREMVGLKTILIMIPGFVFLIAGIVGLLATRKNATG